MQEKFRKIEVIYCIKFLIQSLKSNLFPSRKDGDCPEIILNIFKSRKWQFQRIVLLISKDLKSIKIFVHLLEVSNENSIFVVCKM